MPTHNKITNKLIHIGDKTHHHDQEMTPPSLRPMKRMVSIPVKPIPPEEEDLSAMVQAPRFQAAASRSFWQFLSLPRSQASVD